MCKTVNINKKWDRAGSKGTTISERYRVQRYQSASVLRSTYISPTLLFILDLNVSGSGMFYKDAAVKKYHVCSRMSAIYLVSCWCTYDFEYCCLLGCNAT